MKKEATTQHAIWKVHGDDARSMTMALLEACEAQRFVPAGASVALKPNLVLASAPEQGAVTHPGVLVGCIEYFQAHGVCDISIIESSWIGDKTIRAMRAAGYDEICSRYGVPFFDLKRDVVRSVSTPIGPIDICQRALDAGLLVDLPVLKGHCQTNMTCALKNLKGCIPDREKRRFHALGLTKPIAALGAALRSGLVVVDSICGDLCFEEGGTPIQTNLMYACADPVRADAYGRTLMGLAPEDVPYIELAERYGAGSTAWSEGDVISLNQPSDARGYPRPSGTVAKLTRNVCEDRACSACYAALVRALYTSATTHGSNRSIYIGQGWQGKSLEGLGIGRCCAGATTYVKGCPPTPGAIAEHL